MLTSLYVAERKEPDVEIDWTRGFVAQCELPDDVNLDAVIYQQRIFIRIPGHAHKFYEASFYLAEGPNIIIHQEQRFTCCTYHQSNGHKGRPCSILSFRPGLDDG